MRYCDHNFVPVTPATTMVDKTIVVCIFCGQVRHVYTTGRVVIEVQEGKVEKRGINTGQNTGDR
jgi:hypothetical protein